MGIGISGLTSGMDTDSIVEAMVMDKTERKNQLVKAQTKLEWKQDAWKTLNSKIYSFYTKTLSNMRLAGSYNKTKVSVSNPSIATIVAQSGSVNGTQSLGVQQLAKAGYLTGGKISASDGSKVSGDTKLSELGISDTSVNITVAGKESVISINGETTVNDFVSQLKKAGVNASFDKTNQRFFVSAKDSGADNDFSFTTAGADGISALKKLGLYTGASTADTAQYTKWAKYTQADITRMIQTAYESQKTDADKEKSLLETAIQDLTTANEELENSNKTLSEELKKLNYKKEYAELYRRGTSTDYYKDVDTRLNAYQERVDAGETLSETEQAEYEELQTKMDAVREVDEAIGDGTLTDEDRATYIDELDKTITSKQTELADNTTAIARNEKEIEEKQKIVDGGSGIADGTWNEAGEYVGSAVSLDEMADSKNVATFQTLTEQYTAKWQTAIQYTYKSAEASGKIDADGNALDADGKVIVAKDAYEAAKAAIGDIGDIDADANTDGNGAVRVDGQNAIIYLNGAKFEGASNTVTVNGLTITAQEVTGTDVAGNLNTVSVTTSTDAQGVYDMVKEFLTGYNELINEMDKLYNAASASGYEPLTSDEKSEMTDDEIELWETKIKDSLLRRDTTLNSVINVMKNSMARGVSINGKQSYLSEFGIQTAGYLYAEENERGAYHIDGDEDDSYGASNTDKLMAAILSDPDHVTEVISGIATNLYDNLTTAMRSTTLSSSYTVYNDKQMKTEYTEYTEKIAAQEEKIIWWEDYYRSKFTAMESMLASLNSQQSSLSGLLG